MPTRMTILWRLCDWYNHERKVPMSEEALVEIFRVIAKPIKIPRGNWTHKGNGAYTIDETRITPRMKNTASFVKHIENKFLKRKISEEDYRFAWIHWIKDA